MNKLDLLDDYLRISKEIPDASAEDMATASMVFHAGLKLADHMHEFSEAELDAILADDTGGSLIAWAAAN